jgi:lysophospholipase L1-like esterase
MTTLYTDAFSGSSGVNLAGSTHNPSTGTYSALQGTLELDGNGYWFNAAVGNSAYDASPTFSVNQTVTITANWLCASDDGFEGLGFTDGTNAYILFSQRAASGGGGWTITTKAGISGSPTGSNLKSLLATPLTAGHVYNITFTYVSNGTTVTLSGSVFDQTASTSVWVQGAFTDTNFPSCTKICYFGTTVGSADTATTGHHIGAVSVTYTVGTFAMATPLPLAGTIPVVGVGTATTVTLTGTNNSWLSSSPVFSANNGATVSGTSVTGNNAATFTLTTTGTSNTITITDSSSGYTQNLYSAILTGDANCFASPAGWYAGTGESITANAGNYHKIGLVLPSSGSVTPLFDSSHASSNACIAKVWVGTEPQQTINVTSTPRQVLTNVPSAAGTYQLTQFMSAYTGNSVDLWANNPPTGAICPIGWLVPGGTSAAPTLYGGRAVIVHDSKIIGFDFSGATHDYNSMDATATVGVAIGQAMGWEMGVIGFGGQTLTTGTGTTTGNGVVPVYTGTGSTQTASNYYAGNARASYPQNLNAYILFNVGSNDFVNGTIAGSAYQTNLQAYLTWIRTNYGTSPRILVIPAVAGSTYFWTYTQAAVAAYVAATGDGNISYLPLPMTADQQAAFTNPFSNAATAYCPDGQHPGPNGLAMLSGYAVQAIQGAMFPSTPTSSF